MRNQETISIHVRAIPDELWRRVKSAAVMRHLQLREVIVQALENWLTQSEKETR